MRVLWALLHGLVVAGCLVSLWLLPRGFPISHAKFWANQIAPWIGILIASVGLVAVVRANRRALVLLGGAFSAATLGLAIGFATSHSSATPGWVLCASAPACLIAVLAWSTWRAHGRHSLAELLGPLPLGGFAALLPFACVAPPASTHPRGEAFDATPHKGHGAVRDAHPAVRIECGEVIVTIEPLLTFGSRSPDGGWTFFASPEEQFRPRRVRTDARGTADEGMALYEDDGASALEWHHDADGCGVTLEATSSLANAVNSHLNSYARLFVAGLKEPELRYEGSNVAVAVLPSDYPTGRPARFAYLDAGGVLRVVEAKDAEKGPFSELTSAPLTREDALRFTLRDGEADRVDVTIDDYAAQASVELSPSAGWGVPQNAIQFAAVEDRSGGGVDISLTLAGTGIGRGFDAVGHRPGVYRNRMRVRVLPRHD